MPATDDARFSLPLYTPGEAATYLGVPSQTLWRWARGYRLDRGNGKSTVSPPIITALPARDRLDAVIPFGGLVEGVVLAAFRNAGVPMQRIRPALAALSKELAVEHALASQRLYTDGAEVLYDVADARSVDPELRARLRELVVIRSGQRVFAEVVQDYLKRIDYEPDGWARRLQLPGYTVARVVVDPKLNFGQPYFTHGGVRIEDVLDRWYAGESWEELEADYGVPRQEIEDAARVSKRKSAA